MAIKNFEVLLPQLVGLLTFTQSAKIKGSEFHLAHPDNIPGQQIIASEAIAQVCSVLGVRSTVAKQTVVADAFITKSFANEKGNDLVADIVEALKGGLAELAPEDDFEDENASDVKRAITKANGLLDRIVASHGALVLIHTLYVTIVEQGVEDAPNLAWFFVPVESVPMPSEALDLDFEGGLLPLILDRVKACSTQLKKWEKENIKFTKTADFVTHD